ncbi:NADAR family protein [Phanerochaete sordida]|uniref:NADAR family protein n=1 Tax=Phanerochaete sordida TaxID=48140 RepID=A0A9P3GLS4_9APHY|nr:NADAR family protein [Phanerochaete sordida]
MVPEPRHAKEHYDMLIQHGTDNRPQTDSEPQLSQEPIYFYDEKLPYSAFANFAEYPVEHKGTEYATAEHLFQALKFLDAHPALAKHIRAQPTARAAVRAAMRLRPEWREDWCAVSTTLIEHVLVAKFTQHLDLRDTLLSTGQREIVMANPTDNFWGHGPDGRGRNELGKALMRVRNTLRSELLPSSAQAQQSGAVGVDTSTHRGIASTADKDMQVLHEPRRNAIYYYAATAVDPAPPVQVQESLHPLGRDLFSMAADTAALINEVAALASFPPITLAAGILTKILEIVKTLRRNKEACTELSGRCASYMGLIESTLRGRRAKIPTFVQQHIADFESKLREIHRYVEGVRTGSWHRRLLSWKGEQDIVGQFDLAIDRATQFLILAFCMHGLLGRTQTLTSSAEAFPMPLPP